MTFATIQDPVLLLAFMLYALTGGDVVQLFTVALSSGTITAIVIGFVGLKRIRAETRQRQRQDVEAFRTVAATEANTAMQVMGAVVDRVAAEQRRVAAELEKERAARIESDRKRIESDRKLAECREQCDECLRLLRRQEGQE